MQTAETQLVEGLPRPPHWYTKLSALVDDDDVDNCSRDFIDKIDVQAMYKDFPPPPVPEGNILSFGVPMNMDEVIKQQPLDSDTKLFRDTPDANGFTPDLRDEFGRLLEMMVDDIGYLMGQCSQAGAKHVGSINSTSKKIIKEYRNLHYILTLLRDFQFYDELCSLLKAQFFHRLQLINDIRAIGFNLKPLTQSDFERKLSNKESR